MVGEWIDRGDLWRNKALSLQHRLRDRFRVAVDRHRHRPRFSDGYFSSKMERWLRRFRSFRKDTLPSTAAFYRKRGRNIALWNYQLRAHMLEASRPFNSDIVVSSSLYVVQNSDAEEDSVITRMLQAVPVLGNVCHVFMHGLNRVQIYSAEKLQKALVDRPEKQPLLTVSNHVASMDDPLVIASLLPPGILLDAHKLRWTLCATDRCFRNPVSSAFFRAQVVGWPPVRSFRKNTLASNAAKNNEDDDAKPASGCVYVKVSMDGAPYLRKVDLKTHSNYSQLSLALEKMFSCFTIGQCSSQGGGDGLSERHLKDLIHGSEYVLTYEDKDGDWMLVGDVPWDSKSHGEVQEQDLSITSAYKGRKN